MDPLHPGGILYLWNTRLLFATDQMQTEFHQHYAATIAIALEGDLLIETAEGGKRYEAALVTPNTYHRTLSPGVKMVAFILDPETLEYYSIVPHNVQKEIIQLERDRFAKFLPPLWDLYYGQMDASGAYRLQLDLLESLGKAQLPHPTPDPRILAMANRIRSHLPEPIGWGQLAAEFELSEDRLMRLFKETLGIPLRRYILWVRLTEAARFLMEGMNLTDAAHAAGFADSAHFSRTFKENFGFVPSLFFGHLKSVELLVCKSEESLT